MEKSENNRPIGLKIFLVGILIILINLFFEDARPRAEISFDGKPLISAEISRSDKERYQGLSGRESICDECGMLFLFDKPGNPRFSMRDMDFSLDFIWISGGKVVEITENVPADFLGTLIPENSVNQVLEINAGAAKRLGIRVGQKISID